MTLFKEKKCQDLYKNLYRKIQQQHFADLWNNKDIATIAKELKATVNNDTSTVYLDIDGKPVDTDKIVTSCDNFDLIKMFVRAITEYMLNQQSPLNTARATAAANVQARAQQRANELKKSAALKAIQTPAPVNGNQHFSTTPLSESEAKRNASKGATPTEAVSAVNKANGETATNSRGNVWSAVLTEPDTYLVKLVEKGNRKTGQASEKSGGRNTRRSNRSKSRNSKSRNNRK